MIENNDRVFVIDTGPDFRQQMLRAKASRLDAVIFTHQHKDHTAGFDDIRGFNFKMKCAIDVYCTSSVLESLKREFSYIFSPLKYHGIPEVNMHVIRNETFSVAGTSFVPIEVYHHMLPVYGYRIGNFTYITDANFIQEDQKEKIRGSEVIVLNALRREYHLSHFTFKEAVTLLEELKPKKAYLTHISHQLGLHREVEKELPEFISLAYDGLEIEML